MSGKELSEMPKWVQNSVKAIFLTGFTVILALIFYLSIYFLWNSNNAEAMFGYYIIAQMIISFAFLNGNIKIDEVKW